MVIATTSTERVRQLVGSFSEKAPTSRQLVVFRRARLSTFLIGGAELLGRLMEEGQGRIGGNGFRNIFHQMLFLTLRPGQHVFEQSLREKYLGHQAARWSRSGTSRFPSGSPSEKFGKAGGECFAPLFRSVGVNFM